MEGAVTLRTKKFMYNKLLARKQMVVEITHPGCASVSRKDVQEQLAKHFKIPADTVLCYNMNVHFGGGKTTGLALVYDSVDNLKKYEPKYRQIRNGLASKATVTRRMKKEMKKRLRKIRGIKRNDIKKSGPGSKKK